MSDYDPVEWSTDLDGHGHAPVVELDMCAKWCGHGMEAVKAASLGSITAAAHRPHEVEEPRSPAEANESRRVPI